MCEVNSHCRIGILKTAARRIIFPGALLAVAWLAALASPAWADPVQDKTVQVDAQVQVSPPAITLNLRCTGPHLGFNVYRRTSYTAAWGGPIATLTATGGTNYTDTAVTVGTRYEYQVIGQGSVWYPGYVSSGINVPLVEDRGKIVLVIQSAVVPALSTELDRLVTDLSGDG